MSSSRLPTADSPFLAHKLDGWKPDHPHIRFPVTVGVYQEGANYALYLTPAGMGSISAGLALPAEDLALIVDEGGRPQGSRLLRWADVAGLGQDVDLVHLPQDADTRDMGADLPVPLLAGPELAVPTEQGSRVAISLHDGCHGAVITPDRDLLAACLSGFLADYAVNVLSGAAAVPALSPDSLAPLLEPLPAGDYFGLRFQAHRRYWTLDARRQDEDQTHRWVCEGEGGRWRPGWSW